MMRMQHILSLLSSASLAAAETVIDLSQAAWTLQNLDLNVSVPGSVPSQAHTQGLLLEEEEYSVNQLQVLGEVGELVKLSVRVAFGG